MAHVAIELDNLIVGGLRQYTKSSLLKSRTVAGMRISATVSPRSTEEAAAFICRSLNPTKYRRDKSPAKIHERNEVTFRDPKQTEKVLLDYSASNLPNLILALSLNANVFSEIKYFRHFFAHRSKNTFESVKAFALDLGLSDLDMPEQLMLRGRPETGVRFIDGWLADVENFFDLAS